MNPLRMFTNEDLWNKICEFELDDLEAQLPFSKRLARENGWTLVFSLRAIHEYKKFIYLICISDTPQTPSDEVDQVWHLHLLYTHSYWDDFCGTVLNRKIHHGPTKGGQSESNKYTNYYELTLANYQREFGHAAPEDIWPNSQKRFSDIHFQRVNLLKYRLVKRLFK